MTGIATEIEVEEIEWEIVDYDPRRRRWELENGHAKKEIREEKLQRSDCFERSKGEQIIYEIKEKDVKRCRSCYSKALYNEKTNEWYCHVCYEE